jgi:hypothetical protein
VCLRAFRGSRSLSQIGPGSQLTLLPDQLIVWVSIIPQESDYDPSTPRFPTVLDTGCNHNLVMRPDHFSNLAGYELSAQAPIGYVSIRGRNAGEEGGKKQTASVPTAYDFTIYLYRNDRGQHAPRLDVRQLEIEVEGGIVVTPGTWTFPPVPVFGMRATRRAGLRLHIDSR